MTGLELLLGPLYPGALAPEHLADLRKSGLADVTIRRHKIMSVPPAMTESLLGRRITRWTPPGRAVALTVVSTYVIPYPDPAGGWMDHVRLKVFPSYMDHRGDTVKYLGPKGTPPRLYFPIPTVLAVLTGDAPLWCIEGEKKALAVAQLELPAVGFAGIEGWHRGGAVTTLLPDFDGIPLAGRLVELVPDGDVSTNPAVRSGVIRLADALRARGARPRLVRLPTALTSAA